MNDIVFGRDVSVEAKVNGVYVAIGCADTCSFKYDNEIIGKTDRNAGLFRKKRVRISDTSGSVQGVTTIENSPTRLTTFYFLQEAVRRSEQDMRFVFIDEAQNTRYVQGFFLVKTIGLVGGSSNPFSDFDLQLEGTGNITIGTVLDPDSPGEVCADLFSDTWILSEGETTITGAGQEGRIFTGNEILEVDREGTQYDFKDGSPGNREYGYNGTSISFETEGSEFEERVFVVWKAFES